MAAAGFLVCVPDLERELVAPLIEADLNGFRRRGGRGRVPDLRRPARPAGREQRLAFIQKDKIRWGRLSPTRGPASPSATLGQLVSDLHGTWRLDAEQGDAVEAPYKAITFTLLAGPRLGQDGLVLAPRTPPAHARPGRSRPMLSFMNKRAAAMKRARCRSGPSKSVIS